MNTTLFIGGSHDGSLLPEPPGGFLPRLRVRKKMTWVEEMNAPEPADLIETYELRRLGVALDGRVERVYDVYAVEGAPDQIPPAEVARIVERLRSGRTAYERVIKVGEL